VTRVEFRGQPKALQRYGQVFPADQHADDCAQLDRMRGPGDERLWRNMCIALRSVDLFVPRRSIRKEFAFHSLSINVLPSNCAFEKP